MIFSNALVVRSILDFWSLINFLNSTGKEEHENFIGLSAVTLTRPIWVNLESELYASNLFVPSFFAKSLAFNSFEDDKSTKDLASLSVRPASSNNSTQSIHSPSEDNLLRVFKILATCLRGLNSQS